MSITSLVTAAETQSVSGVNPWLVGGGIFVFLLLLILALLAFGAGREHS